MQPLDEWVESTHYQLNALDSPTSGSPKLRSTFDDDDDDDDGVNLIPEQFNGGLPSYAVHSDARSGEIFIDLRNSSLFTGHRSS